MKLTSPIKRRWEPREQIVWNPGEPLPPAAEIYLSPKHLEEYLSLLKEKELNEDRKEPPG